ncbi:acetyl-CoA C-acetyltransferase [Dethiosulfatibacter aminovorans DSM 17477]|uniref:Acetyl-CoA C-acetyltransferase n=1 Tax=Dethiosulfatibacter aminovorans DSM 17477 TaxID=1121476 RepID=A0A1M6EY72_9FIRM|nr:acetyl-CoA acetyltransferase [Dethiosulfatibacter aminovorans]SHI90404.1 acetyl-CoA C-acetyltransferase [Dethiosulfatibacter aminovorans DSM 17477]
MAEGIKNKVAIIGMGCSKFGELWDKGTEDLIIEAYTEAMEDAGIEKSDIDAVWYGSCYDEINAGKSAMKLATTLKLPHIPVTRVENLCATGSEALRGAVYAVASGASDIALAIGAEKLKDTGFGGLTPGDGMFGTENRTYFPNASGPGGFAQVANAYFSKYGLSYEEGKEALAHISWKSHQNGSKNSKAHLRNKPSMEEIINAPMIAHPLGLYDCCGVSDGAAAAIVVRADMAEKFRKDPIYIKSMQIAVSSGEEIYDTDWDSTYVISTTKAAERAYEEAGITNPREELSMIEVHDCFSITELVTYEDLQISPRGGAVKDILDGFYDIDGGVPCQTDGGLKCFGHPIGASGLRMMYECYKQLQGNEGERQIKSPKLALTHNLGGFPAMCVVSVNIVGNEL